MCALCCKAVRICDTLALTNGSEAVLVSSYFSMVSHSHPFQWHAASRPIIALAPMAGVTDAAYRQLIKLLAPDTITYSEFLSTDAIHYGAKKTMRMLHFDPEKERPFIVQVFGKDPQHFLSAARIIEEMGADGIDINMGCPAAKVVSSCHGSALMRDPVLAGELVAAAKEAVSLPVSVKTRLGWETADSLIPFCQVLVQNGVDALAIHGRTYRQGFSDTADWEPIYRLKDVISVPVIGNGDIRTAQDASVRLGNLDGVMVGRGTWGNPWLMQDICSLLCHGCSVQDLPLRSFTEKIPVILQHCRLAVEHKGEQRGMMEMRKHLASYVRGMDGAKQLRAQLVRVETLQDAEVIFASL